LESHFTAVWGFVNTVEPFAIKQSIIAPQPRAVLPDVADYFCAFVSLFGHTASLLLTSIFVQVVKLIMSIMAVSVSYLDRDHGIFWDGPRVSSAFLIKWPHTTYY